MCGSLLLEGLCRPKVRSAVRSAPAETGSSWSGTLLPFLPEAGLGVEPAQQTQGLSLGRRAAFGTFLAGPVQHSSLSAATWRPRPLPLSGGSTPLELRSGFLTAIFPSLETSKSPPTAPGQASQMRWPGNSTDSRESPRAPALQLLQRAGPGLHAAVLCVVSLCSLFLPSVSVSPEAFGSPLLPGHSSPPDPALSPSLPRPAWRTPALALVAVPGHE